MGVYYRNPVQELLDGLIAQGIFGSLPRQAVYVAGMLVFALVVLGGFVMPFAGIVTWVERRVMARIQSRVGPNRPGPAGFFVWLADGIKSLLKEDIIPRAADGPLFRFAPYLVFAGFLLTFVVLPFGSQLVVADMNVGILYVTAVTGFVVVGILMAGWASNNKWSLLGGIRSAAQIVSYEIPAGLSIFPVVMLSGTLSIQGIIRAQGAAPWHWWIFHSPFTFVAFFVLFISLLAEGNRAPFDLPEAESELVSGFSTEYSGMRYLLFYMAEYGNLYVMGAIASALFLGGWQVPAALHGDPVVRAVAELACFQAKALFWVFFMIWLRWTVPRIRVDQMMSMCWKYLVPIAFVNLLGVATWMVFFPDDTVIPRWALFGLACGIFLLFVRRVIFHIRRARMPLGFKPVLQGASLIYGRR
ncbi:MAG: NADH-quinone oxidoreductase subunit [Candidatus Binatota bacterium]|nr:NADH-quinone oxidoreductase subunit [Candidatus Binatota bacterium]